MKLLPLGCLMTTSIFTGIAIGTPDEGPIIQIICLAIVFMGAWNRLEEKR